MDFALDVIVSAKQSPLLHPKYLLGVIEGNGCFFVGKRAFILIAAQRGAELILFAVSSALADAKPSMSKRENISIYSINRKELVQRVYLILKANTRFFAKKNAETFLHWCKSQGW